MSRPLSLAAELTLAHSFLILLISNSDVKHALQKNYKQPQQRKKLKTGAGVCARTRFLVTGSYTATGSSLLKHVIHSCLINLRC